MSSLMESLYAHQAPNLPPEALADVFDLLGWCLDDNGHSLFTVREAWLRSQDKPRVQIALAMKESFPFDSAEEMESVFREISGRWPDLRETCDAIAERRRVTARGH
jgi:hypothetical protein